MRAPQPGDRIELIAMPNDPDPIPAGTKGTVKHVRQCGSGLNAWLQIDVDWDSGRQLMLSVPPDELGSSTTINPSISDEVAGHRRYVNLSSKNPS